MFHNVRCNHWPAKIDRHHKCSMYRATDHCLHFVAAVMVRWRFSHFLRIATKSNYSRLNRSNGVSAYQPMPTNSVGREMVFRNKSMILQVNVNLYTNVYIAGCLSLRRRWWSRAHAHCRRFRWGSCRWLLSRCDISRFRCGRQRLHGSDRMAVAVVTEIVVVVVIVFDGIVATFHFIRDSTQRSFYSISIYILCDFVMFLLFENFFLLFHCRVSCGQSSWCIRSRLSLS